MRALFIPLLMAALGGPLPALAQLLPDSAAAPRPLTGTVRDGAHNPLAGVTVKLQGGPAALMCITNGRGLYLLTVPASSGRLVVSCVGYLSQEVAVGTAGVVDVVLQPQPGYRPDRKTRQRYRQFNRSVSASSDL